jgi:hypothetical protein
MNRFYLKQAIEALKLKLRGSWMLVRAYDKDDNYEALKRQHTNQQNCLPKHQRVPFIPPMTKVSENAGYVVLKDAKVIVFYCNNLKLTPTSPLLPMDNEEAIHAVNGVCTIRRWTGFEVMHWSSLVVPVIVGAYNSFMNAVDHMDQIRSSCPTHRCEKRVSMTLFTMILDLAIINARAIYNKVCGQKHYTLTAFKQALCEQLVMPLVRLKEERNRRVTSEVRYQSPAVDDVVGSVDSTHYLMNLKHNAKGWVGDSHCYLCLIFEKKLKMHFGCIQCRKAFHPSCFTAFHFRHALSRNR